MQQSTACAVEDCPRPHKAKGLCLLHYRRKYEYPRTIKGDRQVTCSTCGASFLRSRDARSTYCSDACRKVAKREQGAPRVCEVTYALCAQCTRVFVQRRGVIYCGEGCARGARIAAYRDARSCPDCGGALAKDKQRCVPCAELHGKATRAAYKKTSAYKDQRRQRKQARRARLRAVKYESVKSSEIYERDGWVCGICREPVDPDVRWPDLSCASLDHVVPLAKGGPHTVDNVQLAHFMCNSLKGDAAVA